jgi:CRP/FNR family cyclic AMP-dependent transcriptional regulator
MFTEVSDDVCMVLKEQLGLFYFLEENDLHDIACYFRPLEAKAGDVIFREDDPCDYIAFIISGRLEIKKDTEFEGKQVILGIYGPGSIAGEVCFADHESRAVTAVALEDVSLIIITNDAMEELISTHPELGVKFLKGLLMAVSKRLRKSFDRIAAVF